MKVWLPPGPASVDGALLESNNWTDWLAPAPLHNPDSLPSLRQLDDV
jgi:hypothetical protein